MWIIAAHRIAILSLLVCFASGCASAKAKPTIQLVPPEPPPPKLVRRPTDETLRRFGDMVRAYTIADDRDVIIEVDFIPNDSGLEKELPNDVGNYVRGAIGVIGKPFTTFRTLPSSAHLRSPAGAAYPLVPTDRQQPPPPSFRLVGSLQRASEIIVRDGNSRIDVLAGQGTRSFDGQAQREERDAVTSLTLEFSLEGANSLAVRGSQAKYRIYVERTERGRSVSVYVAGSGVGRDTRLAVTQELGDALYDAAAAAVIQALGNALLIPYYRCDAMFSRDQALDARVRDALSRLTRAQLEENVKRFMYLDGFSMDLTSPKPTVEDRAMMAVAMQSRSLSFGDRTALIEFAIQLWGTLDYSQAARRLDARLAEVAHRTAEDAERRAEAIVRNEEFGWPAGVEVVVLDLSRLPAGEPRERVVAVARACTTCLEFRWHPSQPLVGVLLSSKSVELQTAFRRAQLQAEYLWYDTRPRRLRLIPR